VTLVNDVLIIHAFQLARALLDRALDVFLGHRVGARRVDGGAESRVAARVAAAVFGGDRYFTDDLREQGTALRVSGRLVVLDLLPFAVACHTPLAAESRDSLVRSPSIYGCATGRKGNRRRLDAGADPRHSQTTLSC